MNGSDGDTAWDVVVIGGGPAGCVAAIELARRGRQVLLIERKRLPRYKVCGACLSHSTLAQLSAIGLSHCWESLGGKPLDEVLFQHAGSSLTLPIPQGLAVSRAAFDAALCAAAVDAGATVWPETHARVLPCEPDAALRRVALDSTVSRPAEVSARVILAADGLTRSSLHGLAEFESKVVPGSRIGAGVTLANMPIDVPPGRIWLMVEREGYVGLVRTDGGAVNLAAALSAESLRRQRTLGAVVSTILKKSGLTVPDSLVDADWHGTVPLTRSSVRLAGHRLLVAGDATGYVEPFTGEGMTWAIEAGIAVAPLVDAALPAWTPDVERRWTQVIRTQIGRRQIWCRLLSGLIRRPWVMRPVMSALLIAPFLARPIVDRVTRSSPRFAHS